MKVTLITGASSGLGKELAKLYAKDNNNLLLVATNLEKLNADYIILDLGAGSSYNVIDFFLTSYKGTLVVTPELTSILNAYSFLKSTVFRFLYRQFPAKSPERQVLQNSILKRMEGKEYSFAQIMEVMCKTFPETANRAKNEMKKLIKEADALLQKYKQENEGWL